MTRNRFFLYHRELVPWDLETQQQLPWPDCCHFSEVLNCVDRAEPHLGLRFVLTDRVTDRLPVEGDDVVVICIRDELARMPTYAHYVRLVAKTYGVRRTPNVLDTAWRSPTALGATLAQEAIVQARRAPSLVGSWGRTLSRRSSPSVIDIPLGPYLLDEVPFVPFDKRPFDVSYAGSRLNRSKEATRRVPTQKMRSRRELELAVHELVAQRPEWRVGIHIIDTFHEASAHRAVYSQMLMNSRIVLCPRGGSLETYRFFEALRSGAVPVTERLPPRDYYRGVPALRARCWSDLTAVLDPLLSDRARLQEMHAAVLLWWAEQCSPSAVAGRLLRALGVAPRGSSDHGRTMGGVDPRHRSDAPPVLAAPVALPPTNGAQVTSKQQ